jgi:hypothetical protein
MRLPRPLRRNRDSAAKWERANPPAQLDRLRYSAKTLCTN